MVQQTGATVYVVGIGGVAGISLKGERFLKQLANDTGGRAFSRRARSSCSPSTSWSPPK